MKGASTSNRRVTLLPRSRPGWWSLALLIAFVLLMTLLVTLPGTVPGAARFGFLAGVLSVALAVFAVVRRGERSVLVLATLIPGVLIGAFALAEIIVPHD
jgi:hypothetical protein